MSPSKPLAFSYEFFPPRTPVMERRLWRTMGQLERLDPLFFSMTYGALGSAQSISVDTALAMHHESPVPVAAHLTCADADAATVEAVAHQFHEGGIRRIVALRGDAVGDSSYGFPSAVELVEMLTQLEDIDLSVAAYPEGHPQATSLDADIEHLRRKFAAGADRAITQYFFDAECFLRFRDRARAAGVDGPIVPGILPIHDLDKVVAFSKRCGATVPGHYQGLFERVRGDTAGQYHLALDLAVDLCERLRTEGAGHLHLYTLNQTDMCFDISVALGACHEPLHNNQSAA